jgi:hypothetical protein
MLTRIFKKDGVTVTAKLGNYFSVTTDHGCDHDTIRKTFAGTEVAADLDFLMSMHLANPDGEPIHAVLNGSYYLHILLELEQPDTLDPMTTAILASYFRIPLDQAEKLVADATAAAAAVETTADKKLEATHLVRLLVNEERLRWADEAVIAKEMLARPDWAAPMSEDTELWIAIDGDDTYEVTEVGEHYLPTLQCGSSRSYAVARDDDQAEAAVVAYWNELRDTDPAEFRCIIGDKTLIAWACGQEAGPGTIKAKSFPEWVEKIKSLPEEQFASYDGEALTAKVSPTLAEQLGWDGVDCIAFREN